MSIYSIDQLVAKVKSASKDELQGILINLLSTKLSESVYVTLARFIMNVEILDKRQAYCQISAKKAVPYSDLKKLSQSPLLGMTPYFIEAALKPGGPYQTQDVMVNAAHSYWQNAQKKAYYMHVEGIDRTLKVYVGYILMMAGFEKKSAHDKERRSPVKAWKSVKGVTLTPAQREETVYAILNQELNKAEGALNTVKPVKAEAPKVTPNVMDLI